jgi:hypothetical protein
VVVVAVIVVAAAVPVAVRVVGFYAPQLLKLFMPQLDYNFKEAASPPPEGKVTEDEN